MKTIANKNPATFLLFLLCLVAANPCRAQFLNLGLKGGMSLSTMLEVRNGNLESLRSEMGFLTNFTGGATINLKLADRWSFHSEMLFQDKGNRNVGHYDGKSIDGSWETDVSEVQRFHNYYLQFPQAVRYFIPLDQHRRKQIYFEAGPYFACYLSSKETTVYHFDDRKTREYYFIDWIDDADARTFFGMNRFDWGVSAGLGLVIFVLEGPLDLNLRVDQMLQPFSENFAKTYFNVISITMGYSIPVIKKDYNRGR